MWCVIVILGRCSLHLCLMWCVIVILGRCILCHIDLQGRRGRDRMVVGYTTICTIGASHH